MKAIKFKEVNAIYAEDQKEYLPLPVYKRDDGELTICWKLSFKERIRILFSGIFWHSVLTFNQPLQPILISLDQPNDIKTEEDNG